MKKRKKLSDKHKLREFFRNRLAEHRTAQPACRHFGQCGGCEFQDVPYDEQLAAKRDAMNFIAGEVIADLKAKAGEFEDGEQSVNLAVKVDLLETALSDLAFQVVSSPRQLGYRQRMDYVFAFGKAGLRQANRHRQVVELEECPLLGEEGFVVFQKARKLADAAGLESYDYLRHTGELRYFVIRRSRTGGILLSLVTKTRDQGDKVLSVLRELIHDGDIVSGHWLGAEGLGDVSFGIPLAHIGEAAIVEEMSRIRLAIGPNTFFQSNPDVAERAYAAIRGFCPSGGTALDMYSGVGSIALTLAGVAGKVTAAENVAENVELAHINIRENGVNNVELLLEDSVRYLASLAENAAGGTPAMVVTNPPRAGVEDDGMASIKRLGANRLAYLSCNPFTLLRNLADILDAYRLQSLTLYDMFPQTRHFESLALLERK